MKLHPRVSRRAMELVMAFEGFRAEAARLPGGGWTIGYGHTRSARQGAHISRADAELLLRYDLSEVARALEAWVFAPLNANQFDALLAFGFNIGVNNLRRSTVLKRLNEGNYLQAAAALEQWRKAKLGNERLVVDALVRRRAAEKALFLTPPDGFPRAPSPVVRPEFDPEPQLRVAGPLPPKPEPEAAAPPSEETRAEPPHEPPRQTWEAAARIAARLRALAPDRESAPEPPAQREPAAPPAPEPEAAPAEADAFETAEIERPDEAPPEESEPPPPFEPEPPPPFAEATSSEILDATPAGSGGPVEAPPAEPDRDLREAAEETSPPPSPAWFAAAAAQPRLTQPEAEAVPSEDNRRAAAPLALVGLVCFLGAIVSIVQGRPGALNLLFGLGGVVLMAAGYFIWTSATQDQDTE